MPQLKNNQIPVKNVSAARISTKIPINSSNKCQRCHGSKCCQYVTQPIDTPRSIKDFDYLLWQVSHQQVHLFKDSNSWYLTYNSPCTHLLTDGRCGIYEKRPFICREHDNHHCEYDSDHKDGCELYFDRYETLEAYCRQRFKTWDKRFEKP